MQQGRLRVIDPREGERWIDLQSWSRTIRHAVLSPSPAGRIRPPSVLISAISFRFYSAIAAPWCWCLLLPFLFRFSRLAQPLIIQQIIDKVIGQQNFNTLYFLGVLLIGCSIISNILNLIRTFLVYRYDQSN